MTAPPGGVASGFLRHWTGPASSTQEFQGFNIYLKTISSDMVHGLARVRTVTNMGSISFLLLLLLVLITTGFYILTHGAVEPPSRLDARAVQECLFFTSTLQLDSTHLAGDAELEQFYW